MSKKKKKRTAGDWIRSIILILALGIFLFSAVKLVQIFLEYKEGTEIVKKLKKALNDLKIDVQNEISE